MAVNIFEIIGPIMVGPSSSHTAGAARIGLIARLLLGEVPMRAQIGLHGSFAKTYRGHGTDRALAGGLLGMAVDDLNLRYSLDMAKEQGLVLDFYEVYIRGAHPNTVNIRLTGRSGKILELRAASVGGGGIRIVLLNGLEVGFSGKENTLVIQHRDAPGVIAGVSSQIAKYNINIANMKVFRKDVGQEAIMILEIDEKPEPALIQALEMSREINSVVFLENVF